MSVLFVTQRLINYRELDYESNDYDFIINCGDDQGNISAKSLLDLMTIYQEFGRFEGRLALRLLVIWTINVAKSNMQF